MIDYQTPARKQAVRAYAEACGNSNGAAPRWAATKIILSLIAILAACAVYSQFY